MYTTLVMVAPLSTSVTATAWGIVVCCAGTAVVAFPEPFMLL